MDSYKTLKQWRDKQKKSLNNHTLNQFHDELITRVVNLSLQRIQKEWGPLPSPFCFFLMGSGGRLEQGLWSDQDHGIVFEDASNQPYFLALGHEIADGLMTTGYPYCDGGVMASQPRWCQSKEQFLHQLSQWIHDSNWESLRHLLTFLDARPFSGQQTFITYLKEHAYIQITETGTLTRLYENTLYIKKGTNIFGQIVPETKGKYAGSLNMKEVILLPMINAARLLAVHSHLYETATISRLQQLPDEVIPLEKRNSYAQSFLSALHFRLKHGDHQTYESSHYVNIKQRTKQEIQELKDLIKTAHQLHHDAKKCLENRW